MEIDKKKSIIESILFAAGREVKIKELMAAMELSEEELMEVINELQEEYSKSSRGIEIIKVEDAYQLGTKKENYEFIYPIFDKRAKPSLSQAAMESLSIIAYNPKITRAEIESIRGVNSDGTIYKLLEYNLIEEAGRLDAPGRPTTYVVTPTFFRLFGFTSLEELPELPRYKLDENQQIVIDEIIENNEKNDEEETSINNEQADVVDETEN